MDCSKQAETQQQRLNPNRSIGANATFCKTQQTFYSYYPRCPLRSPKPNLIRVADHQTALKKHEIPLARYDARSEAGIRSPDVAKHEIPLARYDARSEAGIIRPPDVAVRSYVPTKVKYGGQAAMKSCGNSPPPLIGALPRATYSRNPSVTAHVNFFDHGAAVEPLSKKFVEPSNFTPILWNKNSINDPSVAVKGTKIAQPLRCEMCNVDCNSKDVLDRHILGKRHKRNLLKRGDMRKDSALPTTSKMLNNRGATKKRTLLGSLGNLLGGQRIMGSNAMAAGEDLQTKKQKLMEGSVLKSWSVANHHETFRASTLMPKAAMRPPNGMDLSVACSPNPTIRSLSNGTCERGPEMPKVIQSAWCETCKIDCNTKDVLDQHKLGKKHKKKLEASRKESNASTSAAASPLVAKNPFIGPMENPAVDKSRTLDVEQPTTKAVVQSEAVEHLETKRRKLLEGGAAVVAVKVCTLCNVVCNSKTVFNSHLGGQKHASMVKKQASGTGTTGQQVITSA